MVKIAFRLCVCRGGDRASDGAFGVVAESGQIDGERVLGVDLAFHFIVSVGACPDILHLLSVLLDNRHTFAQDFGFFVLLDDVGGNVFLLHLIERLHELILHILRVLALLHRTFEVVIGEGD